MEEDNNNKENTELKLVVLSRLEGEKVSPTAKLWFVLVNYSAWVLWLLATFVGAVAVAVTLFVVSYQHYSLYELTHDNFFTFIKDVLPFLWFLILTVMIIFAVYNIRNTRRGYRYPLWQVLGSSLILSFAGGAVLHMIGVGFNFDKWLGGTISSYNSQQKIEERIWQSPKEGRLIGKFIKYEEYFPYNPIFLDIQGTEWRINTTDLYEEERRNLKMGESVRMIGQVLEVDPPSFHACGVFSRLYEFNHTGNELKKHRDSIKESMIHFYDNEDTVIDSSPCADIAPVQRLRVRLID